MNVIINVFKMNNFSNAHLNTIYYNHAGQDRHFFCLFVRTGVIISCIMSDIQKLMKRYKHPWLCLEYSNSDIQTND